MLDSNNQNPTKTKIWPLIILGILVLIVGGLLAARPFLGSSAPKGRADWSKISLESASSDKILNLAKSSGGKTTLVNVWATWCQPCIEEFPYLLQLHQKYKDDGLQLVLVSADVEEDTQRVKEFLAEQGVSFTTYIKSEPDNSFVNNLSPDWSGALPATFIYNKSGALRKFWMGDASFAEFESAFLEVRDSKIK